MAKVLLVEDDNNLREIYEARMQAEGYEVYSAHDGEEALVVAKAQLPDLIIADVMMPRISGFEMLDIIRNTDGLRDVKVIMLTALGQNEDQKRAQNLGADKYLVKSQVTLEDIVKAANDLIPKNEQINNQTIQTSDNTQDSNLGSSTSPELSNTTPAPGITSFNRPSQTENITMPNVTPDQQNQSVPQDQNLNDTQVHNDQILDNAIEELSSNPEIEPDQNEPVVPLNVSPISTPTQSQNINVVEENNAEPPINIQPDQSSVINDDSDNLEVNQETENQEQSEISQKIDNFEENIAPTEENYQSTDQNIPETNDFQNQTQESNETVIDQPNFENMNNNPVASENNYPTPETTNQIPQDTAPTQPEENIPNPPVNQIPVVHVPSQNENNPDSNITI